MWVVVAVGSATVPLWTNPSFRQALTQKHMCHCKDVNKNTCIREKLIWTEKVRPQTHKHMDARTHGQFWGLWVLELTRMSTAFKKKKKKQEKSYQSVFSSQYF